MRAASRLLSLSALPLLVSLVPASAVAGVTYHVDADRGDDANDGKTPGAAWRSLDRVNAEVFRPGDAVLFRAGTRYRGQLRPRGSGDVVDGKVRAIRIGRFGEGPRPRIDGEGKHLDTLLLRNVECWEVAGLEVTNLGPGRKPWQTGVRIVADGCGKLRHIHLRDLHVHDVNGDLRKSHEGCGIYFESLGGRRSHFDDLRIEDCLVERTDRNGICQRRGRGAARSLRVVIRGNRLLDIGGDGIKVWGSNGALIEHNVLRGGRMRCDDYAAGIWPWDSDDTVIQHNEVSGMRGTKDGQAFDSDYRCRRTLFQYNYSHDNDGGFMLVCSPGDSYCEDTVIRYNISQNDGVSGARVFHFGGGSRRTLIHNNTIYVGSGRDLHLLLFTEWKRGHAQDVFFYNNLFLVDGRVSYDWGRSRNVVFESNVFHGRHVDPPEDPRAVTARPPLVAPGSGGDGIDTLGGYRFAPSGGFPTGRVVEDPGGRDFFGNPLPSDRPPSIGAHQPAGERAGAEDAADAGLCVVRPETYAGALRNPLKGLTTRGVRARHPWATLAHHYIRWNEIETRESDGIERIRAFCDASWKGLPERNVKVIPRVYLHWSGDRRHWPEDLEPGDYESERFRARVVRLIERLGRAWDGDPRVAFVEMGIFGKWGEHHSPSPSAGMQRLAGEAFARAFRRKQVSVRHAWSEFTDQPFGEYWDSFAHYQQMWAHGKPVADLNERTGRWRTRYIGGETAYDWGLSDRQPGPSPTASMALPVHRDFVIHTIRWLHATQVRWIADYDREDAAAREGAEAVQRALGYRFLLERVAFTPRVRPGDRLRVTFRVRNVGSAPFYEDWPVEAALLDRETRRPVWRGRFEGVDLRRWLPGDGWTEPEWVPIPQWPRKAPREGWSSSPPSWREPPEAREESGSFAVRVPDGTYLLTLAVLDPAGERPSLRLATRWCLEGGRHPVGLVAVGSGAGAGEGGPLPEGFRFDDPAADATLRYDARGPAASEGSHPTPTESVR